MNSLLLDTDFKEFKHPYLVDRTAEIGMMTVRTCVITLAGYRILGLCKPTLLMPQTC